MPDLEDLLVKTSRTFALSIPALPEPTRREVTTAYLLFRIADTLEDASSWAAERRVEALSRFSDLLADDGPGPVGEGLPGEPSPHAGYAELIRETPFVLDAFRSLRPASRRVVRDHLRETVSGMAGFVSRSDPSGTLQLADVEELRAYCYTVAGLVGEMLTELFLLRPDVPSLAAPDLRRHAAAFGEGLQLVNILKDSAVDRSEGRSYLPSSVPRESVFLIAREDLDSAAEYVFTLQRHEAPRGLVEFTALPVRLARASLDRVERRGPGSKLTRPEVHELIDAMHRAIDGEEPAAPLAGDASGPPGSGRDGATSGS